LCDWADGFDCDGGGLNLKTEMAEGESAAVIGPTRLPASRVASPFRCNRCGPESLVEPSTTPSSSLPISVSRLNHGVMRRTGDLKSPFGATERGVDGEVGWKVAKASL
jgi:hypothetical protein